MILGPLLIAVGCAVAWAVATGVFERLMLGGGQAK